MNTLYDQAEQSLSVESEQNPERGHASAPMTIRVTVSPISFGVGVLCGALAILLVIELRRPTGLSPLDTTLIDQQHFSPLVGQMFDHAPSKIGLGSDALFESPGLTSDWADLDWVMTSPEVPATTLPPKAWPEPDYLPERIGALPINEKTSREKLRNTDSTIPSETHGHPNINDADKRLEQEIYQETLHDLDATQIHELLSIRDSIERTK